MIKKLMGLVLVIALLLPLAAALPATEAQAGRQVWAFYMGWWTGEAWGQRASVLTDRPARGDYDSRDGGVAGGQIDEARSAGIDAFIVSWFGLSDQFTTTPTLNNMLDRAAERGFHVAAAVDVFDADHNRNVQSMVESLSYLVNDRANHPGYLRYNGKPVILFAFQERANFSNAEWQNIRNTVDPGRNTLWISEGLSGCCIHGGVFDGMYAFNVAWAGNPASVAQQQRNATRSAGGSFYLPTVHPGWNEDLIAAQQGRTNPTSPRDRAGGAFLTNSWNGGTSAGTDVVLVVSWNEFIENSHIEPSQVYGSQSLDTLRSLIAAWKGGAPAPAAAAAPASNAGTGAAAAPQAQPVGGVVATIDARTLNVRAAPTASSARVGRVLFGERYQIIGRNGDGSWWLLALPGGHGWISAQYARFEGGDPLTLPVVDAAGNLTAAAPTTQSSTAPAAPVAGLTVTANTNLRMRAAPTTDAAIVGRLPWQAAAPVVGRNASNTWVHINYGGVEGWVSAQYLVINGDLNTAPVQSDN